MTQKQITLIGIVGSVASILGLIIYFIPADLHKPEYEKTVLITGEKTSNNQIVIGDNVTVNFAANREKKTVASASDLLKYSGRITNLPPDILDILQPGINIGFLEQILGKANKKYETRGAIVFRYDFRNSKLDTLSVDGSTIDAVCIESKPGSNDIGFRFPRLGEIALDFQLGVTSWNDVLRVFTNKKPNYTFAGRWYSLFLEDYYGASGKYMIFIVGGKCNIPQILRDSDEGDFDGPVDIVSGGEKKIDYLILSGINDVSKYNFIPICY